MEWFISLLSGFLAGALAGGLEMPLGELPTPVATTEITEVVNSGADGEKMITILLMVALVLAVTLTLGRLYRHSSVAARLDDLDDTESIQAVSGQASLRQRLLDRLGFLRNWRTAASIRRIYHEMCQAADASGYPRTQSETPFEYLITLAEVWPGNTDDSRLITEAYVKVRYGEFPETKQELDAILTAWESLEITKPVSLDEPYIEQRA